MEVAYSHPLVGSVVRVSPNSRYIAYVSGLKLNVVDSITCQPIFTVTCIDKIDSCVFSKDSDRILCLLKERNVVQAFSISDEDWKCRINEGTSFFNRRIN